MLTRRALLASVPALAMAAPSRIVDTHIHLYDPGRAEGVPWPPKDNAVLYRPHMPADFRNVVRGLGVTGAIVVEASPWIQDNDWILGLAKNDPMILGLVGNIQAGGQDFAGHLDRLRKNPLFLGIRVNRTGRTALDDIRRLDDAGLAMDVVGDWPMLRSVLDVSDRLPALRIVIDHLPFGPSDARVPLADFGGRPNVYAKVSWILRRVDGRVPDDLGYYRDALDEVWETFGPDRVVYGSNWPVSNLQAPYASVLRIAREYFAAKGPSVEERYFWKNSQAAYRWKDRK
jgi:L-fuconolactonase